MFQFVSADTPQLLNEVFRIRYQVYCIENEFEDPQRNPGGLERDEFDEHSVHALLVHCASQTPVGTVRLVLHKCGVPHSTLPIHRVCRAAQVHRQDLLPYETSAEISRFAVSKVFRRVQQDFSNGSDHCLAALTPAVHGAPAIPHVMLGLIFAALRLGVANGVTHACAVIDPVLLRLLSRFGIRFQPLGPQVDHHGWRQPCVAKLTTLMAGIERERRDVWEMVTDGGRLWPRTLDVSESIVA